MCSRVPLAIILVVFDSYLAICIIICPRFILLFILFWFPMPDLESAISPRSSGPFLYFKTAISVLVVLFAHGFAIASSPFQ